jgi:hypothetical protein
MNQEKQLIETFGESLGYLRAYLDQKTEYVQLEITEKTAIGTASMITFFVVGGLLLLVLFFAGLALGYFLGTLWESFALGYLAVAGGFLFLLLSVYWLRRPLMVNPALRHILKTLNE